MGLFFAKWEKNYIKNLNPSIEYLELLGVCTAILLWAKYVQNRRIVIFCDNQSVVSIINNSSSSCKNCMHLVRIITLTSLKFNVRFFARWVRGAENLRSDLLSRQKIQ